MQTIEALRQLLAYNQWANRATIQSLKNHPSSDTKAFDALIHILIAEREWFLRLTVNKDTTGFNFWPDLSFADAEALASEMQIEYTRLINSLTEEDLERVAIYKNSRGVEYRTKYRDILMHVFNHSTYHRGQVAMAIRAGGREPANTDYIIYQRETERAGDV